MEHETTDATEPKIHKTDGCTSRGEEITSTNCSYYKQNTQGVWEKKDKICKIGNWDEITKGISNIICSPNIAPPPLAPPPPPPPVVQPLDHIATFTQNAETYGPEHTFTADGKTVRTNHFITQGHCNPKGKNTTNLEEQGTSFCKSIYGDKYNLISDPRAQNLKNDGFGEKYPKIHVGRTENNEWKTNECTTKGYNISNSNCDGKKCKIGEK